LISDRCSGAASAVLRPQPVSIRRGCTALCIDRLRIEGTRWPTRSSNSPTRRLGLLSRSRTRRCRTSVTARRDCLRRPPWGRRSPLRSDPQRHLLRPRRGDRGRTGHVSGLHGHQAGQPTRPGNPASNCASNDNTGIVGRCAGPCSRQRREPRWRGDPARTPRGRPTGLQLDMKIATPVRGTHAVDPGSWRRSFASLRQRSERHDAGPLISVRDAPSGSAPTTSKRAFGPVG